MKLVKKMRPIHNDWQHHKHSHRGDVYFTDQKQILGDVGKNEKWRLHPICIVKEAF